MHLLEREAPLATLHRLRAEVVSDGGRLVFVEGEAGIGKTSLLGAFRSSLPAGVRSFLGACDPLSTPRPLGPLVDIADDLDPSFARLVRDAAPREAVLGALLEALKRATDPPVLLLDDLHWADEATLDALRFVGRRIASTRALVVGTYRDDEVGRQHPLRVVVGDLATSPAVQRLPLSPLSQAAVTELLTCRCPSVGRDGVDRGDHGGLGRTDRRYHCAAVRTAVELHYTEAHAICIRDQVRNHAFGNVNLRLHAVTGRKDKIEIVPHIEFDRGTRNTAGPIAGGR